MLLSFIYQFETMGSLKLPNIKLVALMSNAFKATSQEFELGFLPIMYVNIVDASYGKGISLLI